MKIIPYRQRLGESCLAACLLMVLKAVKKIEFDERDEREIYVSAIISCKELYVVGIIKEFVKRYKIKVLIFVDNKFFTKKLQRYLNFPQIEIYHHKIDLSLVEKSLKEKLLPIFNMDKRYLNQYEHSPHFLIAEKKAKKGKIIAIDPWDGKRRYLRRQTITEAINSLKNHLRICPLMVVVK